MAKQEFTTMTYETKTPKFPFLGWLLGFEETSEFFVLMDNSWHKAIVIDEGTPEEHLWIFGLADPKMQHKLHKMYDKMRSYAKKEKVSI